MLQAAGPAKGVAGVAGRVAGTGVSAAGGAECLPAGADTPGRGTQRPEGNQPEPGPQQRPPHQPVPGINQSYTGPHTFSSHRNVSTRLKIHTGVLFLSCQLTTDMHLRDFVLHSRDTQMHCHREIEKQIYLKHYWAIKQNLLGLLCRF